MEPSERSYELLTRLSRLLQSHERAETSLNPVQLQAVLYLSRSNRYSDKPSAVAEYLGITKGTASQTLNALERAGYVVKRVDPDDKRAIHLRLSAKGKRLVRAAAVPAAIRDGVSALSETEILRLNELLGALLVGVQRSFGQRSFGVCHSCRHFQSKRSGEFECGLTGEPLTAFESDQICREHEPATA